MFNVTLSPTFWGECKVQYTGADGKAVNGTFGIQFKRIGADAFQALVKEKGEGGDEALYRDLIVSFRGIELEDPEGNKIAADDTERMIDALVQHGFSNAMQQAFRDGMPKAKAKN